MARERDREREDDRGPADPSRRNPFERGVDRRRVLRSSSVVSGTAALAGCLGNAETGVERAPTVYVFNNGDRTLSVDVGDQEATFCPEDNCYCG